MNFKNVRFIKAISYFVLLRSLGNIYFVYFKGLSGSSKLASAKKPIKKYRYFDCSMHEHATGLLILECQATQSFVYRDRISLPCDLFLDLSSLKTVQWVLGCRDTYMKLFREGSLEVSLVGHKTIYSSTMTASGTV